MTPSAFLFPLFPPERGMKTKTRKISRVTKKGTKAEKKNRDGIALRTLRQTDSKQNFRMKVEFHTRAEKITNSWLECWKNELSKSLKETGGWDSNNPELLPVCDPNWPTVCVSVTDRRVEDGPRRADAKFSLVREQRRTFKYSDNTRETAGSTSSQSAVRPCDEVLSTNHSQPSNMVVSRRI